MSDAIACSKVLLVLLEYASLICFMSTSACVTTTRVSASSSVLSPIAKRKTFENCFLVEQIQWIKTHTASWNSSGTCDQGGATPRVAFPYKYFGVEGSD